MKRSRIEAEQERAWLYDVVARSLNEVYVFDPVTLRFRFVNRGACHNIGYTQEELAGLTPLDIKPRFTAETFRAMVEPLRTAGRPVRVFETIHRRKDGSEYPVEVHLQLVDSGAGAVFLAVINDITERKQAEEALRSAEARYRVLFEQSPEGILLIDAETGKTIEANEAAHRQLGYSREEFAALGISDYEASETPEETQRRIQRVLSEGSDDFETLQRTKSGEIRNVHVWAKTLRLGGRSAFYCIFEDITERRQAEEALRGSEARYRAVTQSAKDAIVTADGAGNIVGWNRGAEIIFGYPEAEVRGQPLTVLMPQRYHEGHLSGMSRVRSAGEQRIIGKTVELTGLRKDKSEFPMELSLARWEVADGWFVTGMMRDVTERKRAEDAILEEKAFSEAMLDSLPGIFYLFDQTGRFLRWNHSFETVSGYSADEIAAMRALDFFTGEDKTLIEERIGRVFETGAADAEAALLSKDGRRTPYYFVGARFAVDGVPCCIGMGVDVTARKHLEAQLQQFQKLEAIGQLAGGVAHDFNNILGVILGYGEMAQRQLGPEHPVRVRVDQMVKAGQRAAGLTHQLLAFSRNQVMQPRLLDLNVTIADTHKMLGRLIGEDVDVVVHPAAGLGTVNADPGQIEQIILNLAVNARDAMPKGGSLTIETANVDLDEDYAGAHPPVKAGRHVMLAVSDTGMGMDQETQRRIFEPFFTTKPEGLGTGLGLATVYGIVKQSGGYIWVYSEPGRGTTFKVYLPRVDEGTEAAPAGLGAEAPSGHETILLVEDGEMLRAVIEETLEERGYAVLLASNGEDALALARAREGPIDLLLTDVVMPKLGGGDLAKLLSASRPGIRVLYMSGYTDGAISHHGVLGEGVVLLEKPFTSDKLARAVREALDGPTAK